MKTIILALLGPMLVAGAVYAAETVTGAKPLTYAEFLAAPGQHGLSDRVALRKYEIYKRELGNVPKPNLDKTRLRSDEIRQRF